MIKTLILNLILLSLCWGEGFFHGRYSRKGVHEFCYLGRPHKLTYDVNSTHGTFVDLNNADNLKVMDCNTDATKILLGFLYPWDQEKFKKELLQGQAYHTFITGHDKWSCKKQPLLARVDSVQDLTGFGLELSLSEARYDQIFEDADLTLGTSLNWDVCKEAQKQLKNTQIEAKKELSQSYINTTEEHVCIGYNSRNCETANGPIQVWGDQYFSIICTECYIILEADVFFDVKIRDFTLNNMSVGFKDGKIKASFIFDFIAHYNWGTGIDKDYPIIKQTNVIDFFIGPIPFHIYFEVPLNLQTSVDFNAKASVTLGAAGQMDIGDLYVQFKHGLGWSSVATKPTFKWTPTLTRPTAEFNAFADFSLTPQFIAHFDQLFTSTTQIKPLISAQAQGHGTLGKDAWICAQMDYSVTATTTNELDISVPWLDINSDHVWTHVLWETGKQLIGKVCQNISTFEEKVYEGLIYPVDKSLKGRVISENERKGNRKLSLLQEKSNTKSENSKSIHKVQKIQGNQGVCIHGRPHLISYNATVHGDFLRVEEAEGITNITCNFDDTRVLISFQDGKFAEGFSKKLTVWQTFLTAGIKYKCDKGNMLRRVISWAVVGNNLEVKTTGPVYSEIFEDASISFGPSSSLLALESCGYKFSKTKEEINAKDHVCLPINANKNCSKSDGDFILYQNQYITLNCVDCFLGLTFDIFFDIKMDGFALTFFQGGFADINVDGAIVIDWQLHLDWSTGVDRTFPLISPTTIIGIWIGPVPLTLDMSVPVEIQLDADFFFTANATIGALADWDIGSAWVKWKAIGGWQGVSPSPKLKWNTIFTAPTAQFGATSSFAIMPSWQLHVDGFYSLVYTLDPHLNMVAKGNATEKKGEICAKLTEDIDLVVESEIEIAIPWTSIHIDLQYGPKQIWNGGTHDLEQKCVTVK